MPHETRPSGRPGQPSPGFGLRFELLTPIAMGSTARVDLCRSLGPQQPGQLIVVKRPLAELLHDEATSKRFLDEVWMTAALRHPNVVGVVGWGNDELGPYLAVELVQGVSLARLEKSVFETFEQFPERLVVFIALCVARGLGAAHDLRSERGELLQLVHRDLTASNVLVGFGGEVKIADFGLAKAKDRLTVTTSELPTRPMGHIAPEELAQHAVDHRSDLFALGVMIYELLTGRPPFTGKDELSVLEAVMRRAPADPLELRPKMDRSLARLVLRCLEKSPAARPQSAHEVAAECEQWLFAHGYLRDSQESLSRFVRRNSMRQMRWFERVIAGEPEPAPAAFIPPQPSFYPLESDSSGRATSGASQASAVSRRDAEPTIVDGRKQAGPPPPRRSRSQDAIPAAAKSRRRDSSLSNSVNTATTGPTSEFSPKTSGPPYAGVPSVMADDEGEDVPTVALRVDRGTKAELRALFNQAKAAQAQPAAEPAAGRAPLPTMRIEDVDTTQDPTLRNVVAAVQHGAAKPAPRFPDGARAAGELTHHVSTVPPAAARAGKGLVQQIESELERFRSLAKARHDEARKAREIAHRAALDAERAEGDARGVERALAALRQALDLAARGDAEGAGRRLDEARGHVEPRK